jgi:hypothetical protein
VKSAFQWGFTDQCVEVFEVGLQEMVRVSGAVDDHRCGVFKDGVVLWPPFGDYYGLDIGHVPVQPVGQQHASGLVLVRAPSVALFSRHKNDLGFVCGSGSEGHRRE